MKLLLPVFSAITLSTVVFLATGCSTSFNPAAGAPSQVSVGTLQGNVHGGQQPVVGAKVYLFATGTGGSGGNGIAASTANQSVSLLTTSGNTSFDGTNYYVLTGNDGSFSISGDYHCTLNSQVYLYAVGGNPGDGGINTGAGFLAGLGSCPAGGNFAATIPFIFMDEISTVATAYSLAGFATDATHISTSGSSLAGTGIANAMATVANISNIANGTAYATTHAMGSSGTVPQSLIYTVADILATCVNTADSTSASCSTLFNDDRSGGGQTGTKPTDTATAAIYLAQHPYSPYVTTLFNLISAAGSPFVQPLSSAPANYVLAITYTGNGVTRVNNNPGIDAEYTDSVAIDGFGNVWVTSPSTNALSAFSELGSPLAGSPFSGNGLSVPNGLAIDINNRVWVANYSPNSAHLESLSVFNDDGSAYSDITSPGCIDDPGNIAFDHTGNAWLSVVGGTTVCKINSTGTSFTTVNSSLANPLGLAGDTAGNMWVTNTDQSGDQNQVNEFNSSGTNVSHSPFTGSQISETYGIAVDANNNAWIASQNNMVEITASGTVGSAITAGGIVSPNGVVVDGNNDIWDADFGTFNDNTDGPNGDGAVIELNSSATPLSGTTGYQAGTSYAGQSIAIDGSGNVWLDNAYVGSIRELIGAAAPVVTPLAAAVKNSQLAVRP